MLKYAAGRVLQLLLSLWVAMTLLFVAVTQLPGDPVRALFGFRPPPPELYARIRTRYGLDEPLWEQYRRYFAHLLTGDLGNSYPTASRFDIGIGASVNDTLAAAAPVSARLLVGAVLLQLAVGVAAGALSARRGSRLGTALYLAALGVVATPVLVAAYLLRTVVGLELGWLPSDGLLGGDRAYVLPVLSLAGLSTGYVALLTRSEVRETLAGPFVRAARARGLRASRVLAVHALRPSLVPVVAFVAANTGQLVVGLIVVEGVFDLPGVGGAIFQSIRDRDRSLLVGLVTVVMVVVLVANAVADLLAAALDPRLRSDPARE